MAWTYSDWITKTDQAERLERLRLHLQEVSDQITAAMRSPTTGDYDARDLRAYYETLLKREAELAGAADELDATSPGVAGRFVRGRPL